ncbi:hypothetical protein G6F33_010805 [Rhizopus arrhizus]|nr:hypothetical protein G6F23_008813 [Rhizopus arrhizus]KAG0758545.1 hypothetical protein G6F24_009728 [Rhizopus arrhizus]KAG0907162.1 hypothetical protein G6F33_010805 [Rhizopus arrhizus]KAG0937661.1 hypothetical protein G6F32_009695 [Rhizopus arrhizus]KAG1289242.1 hypothetical protein G6F66_009445 [Rhizopus arrhizus]
MVELNHQQIEADFSKHTISRSPITNNDGKIQYGSALRHRNVEICPHGAFAQYFFSLFHHQNITFSNFSSCCDWYDLNLFSNATGDGSIIYSEQAKIYKQVLRYCGVHSSKPTHINKKNVINMVTNEVVSEDQQRQVRRWDSDRIGGCYLSDLPIDATKVLAGLLLDLVELKKECPESFIWPLNIFGNNLYKDYKERLSFAIAANDKKFKMNQHLEALLPEVTAAMKTGFDSLNAMLNIVQSQNQSTLDAVKKIEAENRTILADSFLQISNMLR